MRIIASALALALISVAAPAASACRVGPIPILVPVWEQAPTPDQLRPGEVALEVTTPSAPRLMDADDYRAQRADPTLVVISSCNPDQQTLFQVVRVLSGDTDGTEFVVVPGSIALAVVPIDPATGEDAAWQPAPQHWFVVGRLHPQSKYVTVTDDPAAGAAGRTLPALDARWPPQ